jgi:hypothetical protein
MRLDIRHTLQTVSEWVRFADTKAGATLAVDGVMLALFSGRLRGEPKPEHLATFAFAGAIVLATVSGLLAAWTIVPRTRRLRAESLVHYGTIANFDSAERYRVAALESLAEPNEFAKTLTAHIWTISRAADRKYVLVTWAIRFLVSAAFGGIVASLFP